MSLNYVVRISQTTDSFAAYKKSWYLPSSVDANGSFNLNDPVWSRLSASEIAANDMRTGMTLNTSPNLATAHLMAEFQISIAALFGTATSSGSYFMSSSVGQKSGDPPISSAIVTANPGSGPYIVVKPVTGKGGVPLSQRTRASAIPEPASLALMCTGAAGIAGFLRRRRSPGASS